MVIAAAVATAMVAAATIATTSVPTAAAAIATTVSSTFPVTALLLVVLKGEVLVLLERVADLLVVILQGLRNALETG